MTAHATHNGAADAILRALEREERQQSAYRLTLLTGYRLDSVKNGVKHLLQGGAIVRIRGTNGVNYYDLPDREARAPRPRGSVAGRIEIGRGSKWGMRVGGQLI